MGFFSWLGKKTLEQTNPLFSDTWEEFYPSFVSASKDFTEKTLSFSGLSSPEEMGSLFDQYSEEIKKELIIITTDPSPITGLRATAIEAFSSFADFQVSFSDEYDDYFIDILSKDEAFSEYLNLMRYELGVEIEHADATTWKQILTSRYFKMQQFCHALKCLKHNLNEFSSRNYLKSIYAANIILSESRIRKLIGLKEKISEHEVFLLNRFLQLVVSCKIDQNPHYEWEKIMKEESETKIIKLLEEVTLATTIS